MTMMFKNRAIKEITTYALALCFLVNSGLAGIIAYNSRVNLPRKKESRTMNPVKTIQAGRVSSKSGESSNIMENINIGNNHTNSEVNQIKTAIQTLRPDTKNKQWRIPISTSQYQMLARIIKAEAGGEPLEGQVAVAAVLLNRIRSGKFPSSISANVFRNGEFESVSNGYIWDIDPSASSYKAALLALKGWDPTSGSLYFYNPAKTTSHWIWSRPIYTIIGKHYFAG